MNIFLKEKIVWLSPEKCATSITKKIFERYNFFTKNIFDRSLIPFQDSLQSYSNQIDDEFSDFTKIVNIRNPYDRVFSYFNNYYLFRPLTKKTENPEKLFNDWILNSFCHHGIKVFLSERYNQKHSFFTKWTFNDDTKFDYVIKTENLFHDIINLPFIKKDLDFNTQKIKLLLNDNPYINRRYHHFNQLYNYKSAKLVYHYFKPVFYKFNYDPFSFTTKELSDQEKVNFIHGSLDL